MAFTDDEKSVIRMYLGFPLTFILENPRLDSSMTLVGAQTSGAALVRTILAKLTIIETALDTALDIAGFSKADEVELQDNNAIVKNKRAEGRRYCDRLSIIFGVPLLNDAFGEGGYQSGDGWISNRAMPRLW